MSEFSKLCRACLGAMDTFKYYIFEDISPDLYWFCTNIEVIKDEILPKSICNTCFDLIQKFSEFKKTCLQSQNTLLNYYSVEPEKKKLDDDSRELDTKTNILDNYGDKCDRVTVKEEHFEANYDDDINPTELPIEFDAEVEINKSHKDVKVKTTTKERIKLKCELCSRGFVSRKRFEIHKVTHQTKNIFKCTSCDKTYVTWSGLRRHHESWHVRTPLSSVKCRTCGKIAKSRETLRIHEKLMHEERRNFFICNVCGKGCSTSSVLKAHLETHKDNRERHYTCEHCGKKFYTKKLLVSHVQKCHTGRRFICQICSFPFTDKYNLAKHLLNHDGKGRTFKCEVCNKSYTSKSTYVEHQRTHSGERPFVCTYCSKSFTSKKRLTEHHFTHTGEKPHKCTVCDHGFSQRGSLNRHMKIHDRIVPVGN